ncbi:MAG: tripartite tricarboxylate transporter permease [Marinovum sp.]|nr:tripartite tricarboxylate transporter permease [Marinovum sp.]
MGRLIRANAILGLFAVSEIFVQAGEQASGKYKAPRISMSFLSWLELWMHKFAVLRSIFVGFFCGILPGIGATLTAPMSYGVVVRWSKTKDDIGKGKLEGMISADTANNAAMGTAMIPLLPLGLAGGALTADPPPLKCSGSIVRKRRIKDRNQTIDPSYFSGPCRISVFRHGQRHNGSWVLKTSLPILALFLGLKDAPALVIVPSVWSNLIVMRHVGQFRQAVERFWPMLLALLPGLGSGLWALSRIDGVQAGAVLGAILFLWFAFSYLTPNQRLPPLLERPIWSVSGFKAGIVNGVTRSQVMHYVLFLMSLRMERNLSFHRSIALSRYRAL